MLIAGEAAAFHRGPVFGVGDDGGIAASNFRKVVPVVFVVVERNVSVGDIEIERAVIVQVTELRAEAPAAEFHSHVACEIFVL